MALSTIFFRNLAVEARAMAKRTSEIPTLSSGTVKKCYNNSYTLVLKQQNDGTTSQRFPTPKVHPSTTRGVKLGLLSIFQKFSIRFKKIPFSISRFTWPLYVHLERARLLLLTFTQSTLMKQHVISQILERVSDEDPQNLSRERSDLCGKNAVWSYASQGTGDGRSLFWKHPPQSRRVL